MRILLVPILLLSLLWACNGVSPLSKVKRQSPYQAYLQRLEKAELDETQMVKLWKAAGERALFDSVTVTLPYSESGYFSANHPDARSYLFTAREGQVLTARGAINPKTSIKMFTDLFVLNNGEWQAVAHADSSLTLTHEFITNDTCLLRIQPELLADVYYTLSLSLTPILINPVAGASNKSIGSFYGASRDGGKRKHEGVDIFAKKGTPVVAPAGGVVTQVGTSKLGGKVVWIQDVKRRHSYYFAHLDTQLVKRGMKVKQGDQLGTVGNTGNARFTPPHLHFGIYQGSAKDPLNYIQTLEDMVDALPWDTTFHPVAYRVTSKSLNFRTGPGERHSLADKLKKDTFVRVIAESKEWYRVSLPDRRQGFVYKTLVAPISKGKKMKLKKGAVLLSSVAEDAAPVTVIRQPSVEVLASFKKYVYVITKDGQVGWLRI